MQDLKYCHIPTFVTHYFALLYFSTNYFHHGPLILTSYTLIFEKIFSSFPCLPYIVCDL